MTFVSAVKTCFQNYAIGAGRATRSEYWHFFLFTVLITVAGGAIDKMMFRPVFDDFGPLGIAVLLAITLPSVAVQIRRLHDLDKSWLWGFLVLIPALGTIALLIMSAQRGTSGDNRFGPAPFDGSVDLAGHAAAH